MSMKEKHRLESAQTEWYQCLEECQLSSKAAYESLKDTYETELKTVRQELAETAAATARLAISESLLCFAIMLQIRLTFCSQRIKWMLEIVKVCFISCHLSSLIIIICPISIAQHGERTG